MNEEDRKKRSSRHMINFSWDQITLFQKPENIIITIAHQDTHRSNEKVGKSGKVLAQFSRNSEPP
jgi:hypothetical protein